MEKVQLTYLLKELALLVTASALYSELYVSNTTMFIAHIVFITTFSIFIRLTLEPVAKVMWVYLDFSVDNYFKRNSH